MKPCLTCEDEFKRLAADEKLRQKARDNAIRYAKNNGINQIEIVQLVNKSYSWQLPGGERERVELLYLD